VIAKENETRNRVDVAEAEADKLGGDQGDGDNGADASRLFSF
jgi:hypothetical protein